MDYQDIRTLQLLEEIEQNQAASQRYLAEKLNVSLGLVNSFVKRLAQKGYFKITTIPKNRVKYILTPKGIAEKTQLTCEYIQYSYQLYKGARHKMAALFQDLVKSGVDSVAFYGVSHLAEIAYISLQETPIDIVAVIDSERVGRKFMGISVKANEQLKFVHYDKLLVTADNVTPELWATIGDLGIPKEKLITF